MGSSPWLFQHDDVASFDDDAPTQPGWSGEDIPFAEQLESGLAPKPNADAESSVGIGRALVLASPTRDHHLRGGEYWLGSAEDCNIAFRDLTVAARHARVVVNQSTTSIEPNDDETPVWVNGTRIEGPHCLRDGDQIRLGRVQLSLFLRDRPSERPTYRPPCKTSIPAVPRHSGLRTRDVTPPERGLGRAADKLLAVGRVVQAERLLKPSLDELLEEASAGAAVPDDTLSWVVRYALRLATDTRRGAWLDYVVELHLAAEQRMSSETELATDRIRRTVRDYDRQLLQTYRDVFMGGLQAR